MLRLFCLCLLFSFSGVLFAQSSREFMVVSGGPALRFYERGKENSHDKYWGNFIDTAALRWQELKQQAQEGDKLTWLVYRPAYQIRGLEMNMDLLTVILNRANKIGVQLFWFDTSEQLINYLNEGQARKTVPIVHLDYFGHSNKACLMFDYSGEYESQSREFLHERDLKKIDTGIFAAEATIKSWGCHSGEYYTPRWLKRFGVPMEGAIGKTDYSRLNSLPFISTPAGRWVRQ
jgi:hypothetical protein